MSAVSLRGVSKSFRSGLVGGKVAALQSVDLDVMPGEILGLVGPNGAGKSTLLLIIAGMLRADKGQVVVGGHEVHLGGSGAVGYAPERPAFEMSLTAEQMLVSLAKLRGQRGRDARLAAHRALETVRLENEGRRRIRTLSCGMLQRLALAQALIGQPRLLLMDETLSGLDPVVHRDVCEVTREMPNHGMTVMLSSHDLSTIQQLANRVIVIASGTVRGTIAAAELSTPAELQRRFFELIGTRPLRAVS